MDKTKIFKNNIYIRSKVLKQSRESYLTIRNSLTRALMSKKQLLKSTNITTDNSTSKKEINNAKI